MSQVIDLAEIRVLRRQRRESPPLPHFEVVLVENLSIGELAHRLRGTGLVFSSRHGFTVLHESPSPDPAA